MNAIEVEALSKRYRITGAKESQYKTMRDSVAGVFSPRSWRRIPREEVWALKDVSFEFKEGEAFGIIGRNGAGKSTLLKILSRITEPTSGTARIRGRVASLLEVGTGFHPELTGRENVFLNGAILGMTRGEIRRKFDQIVAFAEVATFIDTPVKRYSSGMYVRLAFAVAAHVEPEILLVDEVLAVGDVGFQKKCLGKMQEVGLEGRTVLFVSHNMGAIGELCNRCLHFQGGQLRDDGDAGSVIGRYLSEASAGNSEIHLDASIDGGALVRMTSCRIEDSNGTACSVVDGVSEFGIRLAFLVRERATGIELGFRISNSLGQPVFTSQLSDSRDSERGLEPGQHSFRIRIPGHFLAPDTYSVTVGVHRPLVEVIELHEHVVTFQVEEFGSRMWLYKGARYGNVLVDFEWTDTEAPHLGADQAAAPPSAENGREGSG